MKRTCKQVLALLLLLLTLAGCRGAAPTTESDPTPTPLPTPVVTEKPTYTVQRGDVARQLTFTARVAPVAESHLFFRANGRVLKVEVARGDQVAQGELLAELDVSALERQVAQAELALEAARTEQEQAAAEAAYQLARARLQLEQEQVSLNKLKAYNPKLDTAVAEAELHKAEIDLQRAQADYDAEKWRSDIGARPEARQLQEATLAHARAKAAYDQAVQQANAHSFDVKNQEARVRMAQLEIDRLAETDPRLAQQVREAELTLLDVRSQITDTQILAPFAGEVLAVNVAAGQAVEAFKPVIVVADPKQLEVSVELSPEQMTDLTEGLAVTLAPVNYPGQELPGTIRQLPYPYGTGGGVQALEEADKSTRIQADLAALPAGQALKLGDLVKATVVLERKADVLWLPPAAIRTFSGRKFVLIQDGARQRRVDVTLGIESADRVEVVSGVSEGQTVLGE